MLDTCSFIMAILIILRLIKVGPTTFSVAVGRMSITTMVDEIKYLGVTFNVLSL